MHCVECGVEDASSAHDVHARELLGVLPRLAHVRERRQVVDDLGADRLEHFAHARRVSDVSLAIDAVDLVATLAQMSNELRADEPRRASHECAHQFSFAIA